MIRRLFKLVAVILITGAIASFLSNQTGMTRIEWLEIRIEARTSLLVVIALGVLIFSIGFDRFVGMMVGLPSRISARIAMRRQNQGHQALALGLVAASAGDRRQAQRQAKKATKLMGNTTLTDLLAAQAAGLNGDHAAARMFFEKLAEQRETAFFGKAGLMRLHAEEGRTDEALAEGRQALDLNQNTPELAKALLALEVRNQHWDEALAALNVAGRGEAMERHKRQRMEAVLYLKKAQAEMASDAEQDQGGAAEHIIEMLEVGFKADPKFSPLVLMLKDTYRDHELKRKIIPLLKQAFAARPHPDLARALFDEWSHGNVHDADALAKLIKLIDKHGNDHACLLAAGRLAIQMGLWGEALRLISLIPQHERDVMAWQALADLAEYAPESPRDDWPDRSESLVEAAAAKRPLGWVCTTCHSAHQDWQEVCSSCDSFASVDWRLS